MDSNEYYQKVADYYNCDACNYDDRYWANAVIQRIRQSFREAVKARSFGQALEVGCGTGLDIAHFGSIYPDRKFYGIDLSPAMLEQASRKIEELKLENVVVKLGSPENLPELFPGEKFDHVYVFFGALNTVENLHRIAGMLKSRMKPDGEMVLTFVNKWYLAEIVINLLKFRFDRAFRRVRRVRKIWRGYSDSHYLKCRCFSPWEIKKAFDDDFQLTSSKGYSILYPAWYRSHLFKRFGPRLSAALWDIDRILNHTPAWCLGEYALYSFKVRP
jgi:ubiquinone/menaquinone biosynthesis C-methylase UbiE